MNYENMNSMLKSKLIIFPQSAAVYTTLNNLFLEKSSKASLNSKSNATIISAETDLSVIFLV